jgi:hypothetical protein
MGEQSTMELNFTDLELSILLDILDTHEPADSMCSTRSDKILQAVLESVKDKLQRAYDEV